MAAAAPASAPATGIAGSWSVLVKLLEQDIDYELRIAEEGGKLEAILVSPRSGEHPFRSVTYEGGALRMEIERDIQGTRVTFVYEGRLEGHKLSGKVTAREFPTPRASGAARGRPRRRRRSCDRCRRRAFGRSPRQDPAPGVAVSGTWPGRLK